MMEFLRALAPSHAAAKTRAVPIVQSRFEDSRPLGHVPETHVETQARGFVADQPETGDPSRAITRLVESAHEDEAVPAARADRNLVSPGESRVTLPQVPEQLSVPTSQPLTVRAVPATREAAERTGRVRAVPRAIETPALLREAQPVTAPLPRARATSALPVGLTISEAVGSPAVRGPLSSSAVAARSESRSDTRPIIHVTIDRIDVRAPSVPERPSSRSRSRSNTSASLSDYLRSRQTSRSGGTS